MTIVRKKWPTVLSDLDSLNCEYIVDNSELKFVVSDGTFRYRVTVKDPGPYRVTDEQYLLDYWSPGTGIGWTFTVEGASWSHIDESMLDIYLPEAKHFVVATYDLCLEVLSVDQPLIEEM